MRKFLQLARWATAIEKHYDKPMDMEWAKDGESGELFIVQARPESVQSQKEASSLKSYSLKEEGQPLVSGLAIGQAIAAGKVCVLHGPDEIDDFPDDAVPVTEMTDPDWVPIMKKAAAPVTKMTTLRNLGLSKTKVCDEGLKHLANLKQLRTRGSR